MGFGEVVAKLGPLSDIHTASSAAPEPRFADPGAAPDVAVTIQRCTTNLLFPYTSNQNGDDTRMVIANTSGLLPGDTQQSGSCTIHYHGTLDGNGAAPVDQTSTTLGSGDVLDFTLSGGAPAEGIAGAPTFAGYLMAQCDFLGAEGTAIVNDGLEQHTLHRAEVAASGFPQRPPDSKSLLIPFASNQGGMDTEIVISNTTKDWLNTTPEDAACTIEYFGQNAPAAQLTPVLSAGDQLLFTLSQGNPGAGIAGAPGFEGFVRISCGFSLLRGTARVIGTAPDAFAFAVDPIPVDPPAAPLKAEGPAQVEQVSSYRLLYKQAAVNKAFNTTVTAANYGAATAQCTASFDNVPGGAAVADINFALPAGGFWKQDVSALASPFFGLVGLTCDQPDVAGSAHIIGAQGAEVILSTSYNAQPVGLPRPTTLEPFVIPFLGRKGLEDHQIVLINTTGDPFGTPAQNGTCTVRYFGEASNAGPPPPDRNLSVAAGRSKAFSLRDELAPVGSPDFTGFGVVSCDFPLARSIDARREQLQ